MRPARRSVQFVRALVSAGVARRRAGAWIAGSAVLPADAVAGLASDGVLTIDDDTCRPLAEARTWLKRIMLDEDAFAAQHRVEVKRTDGGSLNLAESPLARLAAAAGGASPFLARHQVEAGERIRRLVERAQLRHRVTMSYSAAHTAGAGAGHAADIGDLAIDARRQLNRLIAALPHECADVAIDVCGFLKGLQQVETERGWPRRSAKLVLRIGLEQAAMHFGLTSTATGIETRRRHAWLDDDARPTEFG